jgi:enamine deaminase RidA (YjgF/YER057c/UK114 family)
VGRPSIRRESDLDLPDVPRAVYRSPVTVFAGMSDASPVDLVRSSELYTGAPYADAAVVRDRRCLVFTAGACPIDHSGATSHVGDVAGQAEQSMDNLVCALGAAGASLRNVVKTTVYVASGERSDLVAAWNVVRRRFGDHDPPATLLGVRVLGFPEQLVEIEAIAALADPPARNE